MNSESISSLQDRLRGRIQREGPISFHDWMQAALYDEREGYYCRPDRIRQGRAGDYRTAPETSSLFAATFVRYFAKLFVELGSPSPFTIIEFGAGAGDFARDTLTVLRARYPEVFSVTNYVIEEIATGSRGQCAATLSEFSDRVIVRSPTVREGLVATAALPDSDKITGIVFSNELIDAFPVHRIAMRAGSLRELCVGREADKFVWVDCDPNPRVFNYCRRVGLTLDEGQVAEINLEAEAFVARASSLIRNGYLITVDYGAERDELLNRQQGTLRAFHRHQLIDNVLSHPGEIDLTATIDWTQMKKAGLRAQLETVRLERLDQFLLVEGLLEELEETAGKLSAAEAARTRIEAREMIMPHGLAASFQVLVQAKQSREPGKL